MTATLTSQRSRTWRDLLFSDLGILILFAVVKLILHTLTNYQYGWHRDELAMLDDARYLDWGYVAYPPVTPFIARVGLELFGPSLPGVRFFSALSQSIVIVLAGLMARELGSNRLAMFVAAMAVAITPVSMAMSVMFQYVAFDYLWWVLIAYFVLRLLKSENPRWWLGIGAVIGLGMMTKYTIAYYVAGIVVGVVLTRARRYLASPWLWGGVALSLLIFLPNLIWQVQHGFISLEFLSSIHARDVRIGRADSFLIDQLRISANPFTIPLWLAGLYFYFFAPAGKNYRMLGWMALVPVALFAISQGRGYYTGPVYPMLLAAGAVCLEQWLASLVPARARLLGGLSWAMLAIGALVIVALGPYAPVNSGWWNLITSVNGELREEIGWPELVQKVASIYAQLPVEEKAQAGILAGNYGEAGAINLYGPAYGLPQVISGVDSYWARGYGDPPPQTLIVVGWPRDALSYSFGSCKLAGQITNRYGVLNEETKDNSDIYLCRKLLMPWPQFWSVHRYFG